MTNNMITVMAGNSTVAFAFQETEDFSSKLRFYLIILAHLNHLSSITFFNRIELFTSNGKKSQPFLLRLYPSCSPFTALVSS